MRDIEKYIDRVVESDAGLSVPVDKSGSDSVTADHFTLPSADDDNSGLKTRLMLEGLLRRWHLVLLLFVLAVGISLPLVWIVVEPGYVVAAYVRVSPQQEDVLTGGADQVFNYGGLQTEAMSLMGPLVVERVADDLVGREKKLEFFCQDHDVISRVARKVGLHKVVLPKEPAELLKKVVRSGIISASPIRDTEVIAVRMKSMQPDEAKIIVDSFVDNYITVHAYGDSQSVDEKIRFLDDEKKLLYDKLNDGRRRIRALAEAHGSGVLDVEQQILAQKSITLFNRLQQLETRRFELEILIGLLEDQRKSGVVDSNDELTTIDARNQYIAADPEINAYTSNILQLRRDMVAAEIALSPDNPRLRESRAMLEAFEAKIEARREILGKEYDGLLVERSGERKRIELELALKEHDHVVLYVKRLRELLDNEDLQAREIGYANLEIKDLEFQLGLDQEMYDRVTRRIKQIEIERRRKPWISILSKAEEKEFEDTRIKLSAMAFAGSLGLGVAVAFLLVRLDKRVWDPDQIILHVDLPLIGTITGIDMQQQPEFANKLLGDFQTVRTNLALAGHGGIPDILAVVSPGTQDGKTTFCVNLASSLAASGKRVMLIDGDLRRPSIAQTLNVASQTNRSHKVVAEAGFDYTVMTIPSTGLDVLIPEVRFMADPYELISSPVLTQRIHEMATKYDHVIIDTPPVLAFPDATIIARIAGRALLVCFVGRSRGIDMTKVEERLAKAGVQVMGIVMNNVNESKGYYRYGHTYGDYGGKKEYKKGARDKKPNILPAKIL
ncbi:polysaccharide biosynthesis tyrosine autokinase [Planctomycetota bacterium]